MADNHEPYDESRGEEKSPHHPTGAGTNLSRRHALRTGLAVISAVTGTALTPAAAPAAKRAVDNSALLLKDPELPGKINRLFEDLRKDKKTQKEFIENPLLILSTRILPPDKKVSAQRISNANRALYSVLTNDGFRRWVQGYQAEIAKKSSLNKAQVLGDLAEAMAKHSDPSLFRAILEEHVARAASDDDPIPDIVIVKSIGVLVINFILISVFINALVGVSNPKAMRISAGDLRSVAERLTAHAAELRKSGKLAGQFIRTN